MVVQSLMWSGPSPTDQEERHWGGRRRLLRGAGQPAADFAICRINPEFLRKLIYSDPHLVNIVSVGEAARGMRRECTGAEVV